MTEDMVKKSVDITEKDNKWLEEHSYLNFSKFVRRKIAERRAENIRDWKKEKLYRNIDRMTEKGQELMKEWKEEKENLQEEYSAEVVEQQATHWIFEYNGDTYTGHWMPGEVFDDTGTKNVPEQAEEFGNKFVEAWYDKIDRFGEFVGEKTHFTTEGGDESGQTYIGEGPLSDFTLYAGYVPTEHDSFTIKFESRVDLEIRDLEKSVEDDTVSTSKTDKGE
jgi:hypothetical protein